MSNRNELYKELTSRQNRILKLCNSRYNSSLVLSVLALSKDEMDLGMLKKSIETTMDMFTLCNLQIVRRNNQVYRYLNRNQDSIKVLNVKDTYNDKMFMKLPEVSYRSRDLYCKPLCKIYIVRDNNGHSGIYITAYRIFLDSVDISCFIEEVFHKYASMYYSYSAKSSIYNISFRKSFIKQTNIFNNSNEIVIYRRSTDLKRISNRSISILKDKICNSEYRVEDDLSKKLIEICSLYEIGVCDFICKSLNILLKKTWIDIVITINEFSTNIEIPIELYIFNNNKDKRMMHIQFNIVDCSNIYIKITGPSSNMASVEKLILMLIKDWNKTIRKPLC